MGYDHYAHSSAYAYKARRMTWKPWKWEVLKYNKFITDSKGKYVGEVYVSNLTKLAADGYVKLLSEV